MCLNIEKFCHKKLTICSRWTRRFRFLLDSCLIWAAERKSVFGIVYLSEDNRPASPKILASSKVRGGRRRSANRHRPFNMMICKNTSYLTKRTVVRGMHQLRKAYIIYADMQELLTAFEVSSAFLFFTSLVPRNLFLYHRNNTGSHSIPSRKSSKGSLQHCKRLKLFDSE